MGLYSYYILNGLKIKLERLLDNAYTTIMFL